MDRRGRPPERRIVDPATHPRRHVSLIVAAEYLGIDRRTLHKLIDGGTIATVTIGCYQRVPVTELMRTDLPIDAAS